MAIEAKLKKYGFVSFNISLSQESGSRDGRFMTKGVKASHLEESEGFFTKTSQANVGHHANKAHRDFLWLPWIPGNINEVATNGMDVLTGEMTGCIVTRYQRGGANYVAHLGTDNNDPGANAKVKQQWNAFAQQNTTGLTGFNAVQNITLNSFPKAKGNEGGVILALVTGNGDFYSVRCMKSGNVMRIVSCDKEAGLPPAQLTSLA